MRIYEFFTTFASSFQSYQNKFIDMITRFAVKNYRGFKDIIEWNLSTLGNYSFNSSAIKDGVVKKSII